MVPGYMTKRAAMLLALGATAAAVLFIAVAGMTAMP